MATKRIESYEKQDGTIVSAHTKEVPDTKNKTEKNKPATTKENIEQLANIEADDVMFALENPEWSSSGFTRDSNWYAHKLMGHTPQQAAKINKGNNHKPIKYDYWAVQTSIEKIGENNIDWNTFPVHHLTGIFNLFEFTNFNQPIDHWDTSNIKSIESLFGDNDQFNQPLNNWDTSNIINMKRVFSEAIAFNQPLDQWDTKNVTDMIYMFDGATQFNQPLNNWDTSNVVDMNGMFRKAKNFNQPLNNWDTSNTMDILEMFQGAKNFNQNLSSWDISNIKYMADIFRDSGMSPQNLSLTLQGWATTTHKKGAHQGIALGSLPPTAANMDKKGKAALSYLKEKHNWRYRIEQPKS